MRKHFSYIQMVISGGEILSASSGLPTKCGEVHEQLFGLRHCPGPGEPGGLRVTIIHSGSNHKLECLPCRHNFRSQLSKLFLQRKVEGLRVWLRSFESGLKLHKSQIF